MRILFFAFMLPILSLSQSLSKLDQKNGFKSFRLGDSFDTWSSYVYFEKDWGDGVKSYVYNGECCKDLYGVKTQKIVLGFRQNKLVRINVAFEVPSYHGTYDIILKKLEGEFGKSSFEKNEWKYKESDYEYQKRISYRNEWVGEKISMVLDFDNSDYFQYPELGQRLYIYIYKSEPRITKDDDGF
jgi:hypothetical protein